MIQELIIAIFGEYIGLFVMIVGGVVIMVLVSAGISHFLIDYFK